MRRIICLVLSIVLLSNILPFFRTTVNSVESEKNIDEFTCEINNMLNTYGVDSEQVQKEMSLSNLSNNTKELSAYTKEFATMRLIVNSNIPINTLNAVSVISGYNDLWVLQFESIYDTKEAYEYYNSLEYVEFVEPDNVVTLSETATIESTYSEGTKYLSWGPEHIGFDKLNNYIIENSIELLPVIVAVLDTGVDHTHSFFNGRVEPTSFNSSDSGEANSSMDDKGHGTHVAGIIADCTPQNVIIKPYKVLNNKGNGTIVSVLSGIYKAIEDEVDVINMSFSRSSYSTSIKKAISEADEKGIVLVAASGNSGTNRIKYYPAYYDEVIAVSSISQNNELSSFSNYGTYIDISAPGSEIKSTIPNDKTQVKSGTSMAAPFVSSVAALAKSYHGDISSQAVKTLLYSSAIPLSGDNEYGEYFGYGLVNAMGILNEIDDSPENLIITTAPQFNFESGVYETFVDVSMTCKDENTTIYYTTDGTTPNEHSSIYDGTPIHIENNTILSAVACAENRRMSKVVRCEYRIIKDFNENMLVIDEEGYILSCASEVDKIIIPETVRGITVRGIRENAFSNKDGEKNFFSYIELPDTVTNIEKNAFSNNTNITEVIADGVTHIDEYAFSECTALCKISFKSVKSIGKYAFYKTGTTKTNSQYIAEFPELEELDSYAFADSKIKTVILPALTNLGYAAFQKCKSLINTWCDTLEEIPDFAFYNCSNLKNISFPQVKSIGYMAFYHCDELEEAEFPECIVIGENAFDSCYQLISIYLPKLVEMDAAAFSWCDWLEKLDLPCLENIKGIDYIGLPTELNYFSAPKILSVPDFFFSSLPIQNVYIPSAKTLGEYAFSGIDTLNYLDISSVEAISTDNVFSETCNIGFIKANNLISTKSLPDKSAILVSSKLTQIDCVPKELTIYGIKDSFAESFANENNHVFIPIPYVDNNLLPNEITGSETVTVDAIGFNLTYQWYASYDGSIENGIAIEGAIAETLDISETVYAPYYYCVVTCTEDNGTYTTVTKVIKNSEYALANFEKIDDALSKVPNDLSIYTQESVDSLNEVIAQINRNTANNNQEQVDKWAEEIEKAIKQLEYKGANYSTIESLMLKAEEIDRNLYTPESLAKLDEAIADINYNLTINKQSQVEEAANAIEKAISELEYKQADYSELKKILATIPSDLSIYTPESVEKLESIIDSIDYCLDITQQEKVDEYTEQLTQAVENLEKECWIIRLFRMIICFFKDVILCLENCVFNIFDC